MTQPADQGTGTREYLLEAHNIVKVFGSLAANDDVSLMVTPGEIHALLGENGAGKSTLVKIIYGALQPNAGELRWLGRRVRIDNPAAARKLGIGMVFQHFSLFEALTVAENIALGLPGAFNLDKLSKRIVEVSAEYGLPLKPDEFVLDLSVGQRQRIEIVRCLLQEPQLLIMDEPTAVLTPQEADQLFLTLDRLAHEGCAILYISHRLEEVKRLCHVATILRLGKVVATVDPAEETAASLARLMVGSDVHEVRAGVTETGGDPLLEVDGFSLPSDGPFGVALRNVAFAVRPGEILAIAGVAGNGQSELFEALSGERPAGSRDAIRIAGQSCGRLDVTGRRRLGAAFVPEERLGHGAAPTLTLSENILLTRYGTDADLVWGGFLDRGAASAINDRITKTFDVRKGKPDPEARALSGGNLQKFVVGRELDRNPKLLVINQPTWGVDAGATAVIRQALINLARSGSAVVAISQDLDEIFEIADRIAVISRGELSVPKPTGETNREEVGLLMAGAHETAARPAETEVRRAAGA